jgi:hypothetical protein
VVGLITNNDETSYREVRDLAVWCQDTNLSLNVSKTKELIVDYRRRRAKQAPINISEAVVDIKQTIMVQTHQDIREESMATPFPHQETEKIWHGSPDPQKVLQLHHREHPDRLHHRLVWQLLGIRP